MTIHTLTWWLNAAVVCVLDALNPGVREVAATPKNRLWLWKSMFEQSASVRSPTAQMQLVTLGDFDSRLGSHFSTSPDLSTVAEHSSKLHSSHERTQERQFSAVLHATLAGYVHGEALTVARRRSLARL